MIEEPYRWVEAIANRREYVESQLAGGSPVVAVSCAEGILFVTVGASRQKVFEIYDRIAMGAIGHPGDIERLRMAAIELASTEGFTRSAADVSLRRLAYYSLSPALKAAFEQIYGAPYLARMLFAEVGASATEDLFLRVEYDGAIAGERISYGLLAGNNAADEAMQKCVTAPLEAALNLRQAMQTALTAWAAGDLANNDPSPKGDNAIRQHLDSRILGGEVEAALLERNSRSAIAFRSIGTAEARTMLS